MGPDVRESEPLVCTEAAGQPAAMEVNTDPVVERAGGAAPQSDVSQPQPMGVSLEQRVTTGATKRAAEAQLTPNRIEGYIGGLRSFDGHHDVLAGMTTRPESCLTEPSTLLVERT